MRICELFTFWGFLKEKILFGFSFYLPRQCEYLVQEIMAL